ncbi:MAG TPA: SAM-dependent chlorinase/fluorinase [Actinomycetota bacterium]
MGKSVLFLSDLGLRDEFVGVCHSVIERIAPGTTVIDLSHGVAPQDVQLGALILRESVPYSPDHAVFLGVVDPGVGTDRKGVVVETESGRVLVGPDNGLLSLAWEAAGGASRAYEIASDEVVLTPVSNVFHGRDVFAPAAAHVAAGMPPEKMGPELDPASLQAVSLPVPEVLPGEIHCQVLDVDRFGNLRLNVRPADVERAGLAEQGAIKVATTASSTLARRVSTYGEVGPGDYAAIEDAWGWVAVIRFEASAAADLVARSGDPVWLLAVDGA